MKHLINRANVNKEAHEKVVIEIKASKIFYDVCLGGWGGW